MVTTKKHAVNWPHRGKTGADDADGVLNDSPDLRIDVCPACVKV